MTENKKFKVICQTWKDPTGCEDIYTLHLTDADRKQFIDEYPEKMIEGADPDDMPFTDGTPYWCEVEEKIYKEIKKSKNGVEYTGSPPQGGVDH